MRKIRAATAALLLLAGAWLVVAPVFADEGWASWYGEPYHGRVMANGQVFDMHDPTTTASNAYPFGTWLRVTNPENGNSVDVQVRDRGWFSHAVDLSYAAFAQLADPRRGMIRITYQVIPGPGESVASAPPPAPPPAEAPGPSPSQPQSPPATYAVEAGESLGSIARRFGLVTLDVANWNRLDDPDRLRPGQVLQLSPPSDAQTLPPPPPTAEEIYVVREGDVLWRIALEFEVEPTAIVRANNLGADSLLRIGQELLIPVPSSYHTVESGETLRSIAERYGTDVRGLVHLNQLDRPDTILVGQELRVR